MPKGKKKKKRHEMPPLGKLDKAIYWISGVLLLAGYAVLFVWVMHHARWLGLRDEAVAAVYIRENLVAVPGMVCLGMTLLGTWNELYEGRQPIFGAPGVYYGPPLPKKYPLFWKDKAPRKPDEKAGRIGCLAFLLAVNLILMVPVIFFTQGRNEWCTDGTVRRVSQSGRITDEYRPEDVRELTLSVYKQSRRRSVTVSWGVTVRLTMHDGEECVFRSREFRDGDREGVRRWLAELNDLVDLYPGITIRDADEIERVIDDQNLDKTEASLLRRMFGIED